MRYLRRAFQEIAYLVIGFILFGVALAITMLIGIVLVGLARAWVAFWMDITGAQSFDVLSGTFVGILLLIFLREVGRLWLMMVTDENQ